MSSEDLGKKEVLKRFEDLEVWRKAHRLVLEIYKITQGFPVEERFSLVSQMRRAVISIPANITEGFRKRGVKDKMNFYNIAQASLDELYYHIILSKDLGFIQDSSNLINRVKETARMLSGLIRSIKIR